MEYGINKPKTGTSVRKIPMLFGVREALLSQKAKSLRDGGCSYKIGDYTDFVFYTKFGTPLNPHSAYDVIRKIGKLYNDEETMLSKVEEREPELLPVLGPHVLRHTFCTRLCEIEPNIKIIQEVMGHSDITTTMNIYTDITESRKRISFSQYEGKIKISSM